MNKAIVMGRLTRDPEIVQTKSGKAICKFSIAVSDKYDKQKTYFFNCVAWEKTGQIIGQHFNKGKQIIVDGSLHQDTWQDQNGQKKSAVTINVDTFSFTADGPQQTQNNYPGANQQTSFQPQTTQQTGRNPYQQPPGNVQFSDPTPDEVPF